MIPNQNNQNITTTRTITTIPTYLLRTHYERQERFRMWVWRVRIVRSFLRMLLVLPFGKLVLWGLHSSRPVRCTRSSSPPVQPVAVHAPSPFPTPILCVSSSVAERCVCPGPSHQASGEIGQNSLQKIPVGRILHDTYQFLERVTYNISQFHAYARKNNM